MLEIANKRLVYSGHASMFDLNQLRCFVAVAEELTGGARMKTRYCPRWSRSRARSARRKRLTIKGFSFRRHSGMVRKHQTRNLEIPGSMLSHRPGMTS
jgi:predicted deacetylase